MELTTQREKVRNALERKIRISALDVLRAFGCFRLAARINELRREGMNIATEYETKDGKRWAVYHLVRGRK